MKTTSQKIIQGVFLFVLCGGLLGIFWQIPSVLNQNPFPDSQLTTTPSVKMQNLSQGVINSNNRTIFYWVQASDIHVNVKEELENLENFDKLCAAINSTIKPAFVMSTGDNVDGQDHTQNEAEYIAYRETLAKYNFTNEFWYGLIGNHEAYNAGLNRSYFTTYIRNETQYAVDFNTGFGNYRFYMLDSTQKFNARTPVLNLYGDMQTNELDNFHGLINATPELTINQSVVAFHHPLNEIASEESSSGENLRDLIEKTHSQYVLNGHIHSKELYVNRGTFSEIQCPSMKERSYYRICAFDNDLMSFSDVELNKYPQVVITNPTDARFYNDNMDLDKMITQQEIRVLLFDNATITSAYAMIDDKIIGNLTHQGNNLWTVHYNPQYYRTDTHQLSIYVQSENGIEVKTQDFQLSDFKATKIHSGFIVMYYSYPLFYVYFGLALVLLCIGLFTISFPFIVNYIQKRKGESIKFEPTTLPSKLSILSLLGVFGFILCAPLMIGNINDNTLGAIFFSHIMVPDGYIMDMITYIFAAIFLLFALILTDFTYRINHTKKYRFRTKFAMLFYYTALIGITIFGVYSFSSTLLLSPSIYVFGLAPLFMLIEKKTKN